MVTKPIFIALLAMLAGQRLLELRLSKRNEARILADGGREHLAERFWVMQALHTSWFLAMIGEVVWLDRPFIPLLAAGAILVAALGQGFRYAAIRTLGWRWTVRILTLPGEAMVERGIYRFVRHPNYLGVILEIVAVPLLHSAYLTALSFGIANAFLLRSRIRAEERALSAHSDYARVFANRPRFIPNSRTK